MRDVLGRDKSNYDSQLGKKQQSESEEQKKKMFTIVIAQSIRETGQYNKWVSNHKGPEEKKNFHFILRIQKSVMKFIQDRPKK